jgi:orotate phosphoribosyltransferase
MRMTVATSAPTGEAVSYGSPGPLSELRDLIQRESIIKRGPGDPDFVLASGRHSRYYCDTKKVTLSPNGSRLVGEVLFRLLRNENAEAVGGLQLGATFIATAVALISSQYGHPIFGFTVRDEQKKHGTLESVAQSYHPDGKELLSPGRRVVVVDDVVTGGESIRRAIKEVQKRHCDLVGVVSLVDRCEGGGERLKSDGFPYFSLFNIAECGDLVINDNPRVHRLNSL